MQETMLVFGSKGYFGSKIVDHFTHQGWQVEKSTTDIRNYQEVIGEIERIRPGVVINAAGKTGTPNVDWCETHRAETMSTNVAGAVNVASACDLHGVYMFHLGSGCIYEGDNGGIGFRETDEPNFYGSFYSRTKLHSEKLLADLNVLQLRIRIPIEGRSNAKNVIDKLLKYEKIISVPNSFTVVEDFLPAVEQLVTRRERGIFNMTNVGSMDHEFLMNRYSQIVDPSKKFTVMTVDEMYAKYASTKRSNCILNTEKREAIGIHMPPIRERIVSILEAYKRNPLEQQNHGKDDPASVG